jgi:hypothetical protein
MVSREPRLYRLEGANKLRFSGTFESPAARFAAASDLLNRLGAP